MSYSCSQNRLSRSKTCNKEYVLFGSIIYKMIMQVLNIINACIIYFCYFGKSRKKAFNLKELSLLIVNIVPIYE